jgi:hypothetical protein
MSFFNSSFNWSSLDSMWLVVRFSRSWFRVLAIVREKHRKRWQIKVGEKGGWVHGKTRLRNDRYQYDWEKKRSLRE